MWKIKFIYFPSSLLSFAFYLPFTIIRRFFFSLFCSSFQTQSRIQQSGKHSSTQNSLSPRPIVVCELSPCLWNDFSSLVVAFKLPFLCFHPAFSVPTTSLIRFRCQNICFYLRTVFFSSPLSSRPPCRRAIETKSSSFVTNKGSRL